VDCVSLDHRLYRQRRISSGPDSRPSPQPVIDLWYGGLDGIRTPQAIEASQPGLLNITRRCCPASRGQDAVGQALAGRGDR